MTQIEKILAYLVRDKKEITANNISIYSLFVRGGTVSHREANMYVINCKINHKANQLLWGASSVAPKVTLDYLHIKEFNKMHVH